MNPNSQERQDIIAYLLSGFPRISETFILNEILELERQGLRLMVFPLKSGDDRVTPHAARLTRSPVSYVPVKLDARMLAASLRALIVLFIQQPLRLASVAFCFLASGKKERHFNLLQSFLRWAWLCCRLQACKITRLHAHFAHDPAMMAYWIWRLLQLPYSFTAHAKDIYCYSQAWLQKKIHHARFVVTCTDYNRNYLQQVSQNGTPIHCLHHGLHIDKFRPSYERQCGTPLMLAVGRLVEKKGFAILLEACALLRDEGFNFRCEIVGEGPQRQFLKEKIEQLRLRGVVALRGALAHEQVIELYKSAAVFVMPSCVTETGDRDGIPNVILEAMAMELPVVASRVSGIPEAVEEEITGILVEEKNAEELARAIKRVLNDGRLARQLGKAGRQKVAGAFCLPCNVQNMKALLLQ